MEIVSKILMTVIIAGIIFWSFNNADGIGSGIEDGSDAVSEKVGRFDYSGTVAPGSGHNDDLVGNKHR